MKDNLTIIEEKLRKHYPISMQSVDDAIQYMADNNLSYSKAGFVYSEYGGEYDKGKFTASEITKVIEKYGYKATWRYPGQLLLKDQTFMQSFNIYIFATQVAFDEFYKIIDWTYANKDNHKYQFLQIYSVPKEKV